ncbi:MAG: glutaredoxin family protein [Solirubrobacterales bacterium]|nr:glutaredoxin family protein [Solirubrobacterales bacterium]MCB8969845.1 glutaredoxin family protein [Thermoleophilales bacterium]MCO5328376.1 glutaredoxin family protein [Solirubrobacterales bacterium]
MNEVPLVTLYGRPGCHLCDEARDSLLAIRDRGLRFRLQEVDIEGDEDLHREMLEAIPVVDVDGVRVSELIFDEGAVLARIGTLSA